MPTIVPEPNTGDDKTDQLQNYIGDGSTTPLRPGTYHISDTLVINRKRGFRFEGYGGVARSESARGRWEGVVLEWKGPSDRPMVRCVGTTGLVMRGINLFGDAEVGIQIEHGEGNLDLKFADFGIVGPHIGIRAGADGSHKTCANVTYDNLYWQTRVGIKLVGPWSVRHLLISPTFTRGDTAIHVVGGGSVQSYGGGGYEMKELLRVGQVPANSRGFLFDGFDCDSDSTGPSTRTAWLACDVPDELSSYGAFTFRQCTQNHNQKNSDQPLLEVPPGAVVTCEDCGFMPESMTDGSFAHVWGIDHPRWSNPHGELNVIRGNNLWPGHAGNYVTLKGNGKGLYRFVDCGSLYGDSASWSNWPGKEGGETPPNEAIENLQRSVISLQDMFDRQDARLDGLKDLLTALQETVQLHQRQSAHSRVDLVNRLDELGERVDELEDNAGGSSDEATQRQITVLKDSLENLVRRMDRLQAALAGHESRLNGHRGDLDAVRVDLNKTRDRTERAGAALKGEGL